MWHGKQLDNIGLLPQTSDEGSVGQGARSESSSRSAGCTHSVQESQWGASRERKSGTVLNAHWLLFPPRGVTRPRRNRRQCWASESHHHPPADLSSEAGWLREFAL